MFGLSKKEQASEKLQCSTKSILKSGFFSAHYAEDYGLNEQASAWLYTEALAHQIYVLIAIFNNTFGKKYGWATPQFMIKAINEAIVDYEIQEGSRPGSISSFIFRRCAEMDALSPQDRVAGEHFRQSASKVAEFDSQADRAAIADRLSIVAKQYFDNAINMFK